MAQGQYLCDAPLLLRDSLRLLARLEPRAFFFT